MPLRNFHPTGVELVKACDRLLDIKRPDQINTEEILRESGISKGSLYHHFVDLPDLIETTLIYRYSKWIDLSIQRMSSLLSSAKSAKALKEALFQITFATQKDSLKNMRIERARIFAEAQQNSRLSEKLIAETERMTTSIEDLVSEVIDRKLFKPGLNARAVAVFIQAYTLGLIVNDFTTNKVTFEDWTTLINQIIGELFIND
jgi:AcrR family transcriptional regulator